MGFTFEDLDARNVKVKMVCNLDAKKHKKNHLSIREKSLENSPVAASGAHAMHHLSLLARVLFK